MVSTTRSGVKPAQMPISEADGVGVTPSFVEARAIPSCGSGYLSTVQSGT